ncbi:MAG: tetratricopeptide repeat protein, partial [Candidatus Hodarchaeota archaeon]
SEKYSSEILEILLKRLIDGNLEVRQEAWNTLTKLRQGFSDSQIQRIIPTILGMLSYSQRDICLKVCKFISNYEKAWVSNSNLILENFKLLLEDEDPIILSYVWDAITDNKILIVEAHHFISQLSRKLHDLNPTSAIQVCKASDKLKLLNRSNLIRDRFIRLLSEDIDHNLRITILSTLNQYKEVYSSIDPQTLISLINQGQWDTQRALIPYLVYYLKNESELFPSDFNFQDIIIDFIRDPLTSRFASTDDQKSDFVTDSFAVDFTEESIKLYFDIANDDARFKKWIDLERKFDFIKKVEHPLIDEIKNQFQEILSQQIKGISNKFGYKEILNQDIDLNTPKKIVILMRQQYATLRECILEEIEKEIDLGQQRFKKLNNVIIQHLLDDPILKIRNYAWNFFRKNLQKSDKVLKDNLHTLVDHINGTFEDTRINAISVLVSHLNIKEPENEWILDKIITKLDDLNFVIRNQIWRFINKELNLRYPRYLPVVQKILNLLSQSNFHNRKEAMEYIENNFQTFSSIIETYPQPNEILHIIGTILIQREEFQQGLIILEEMVSKNPSELNNWLAIAVSYFSMDQPQDAISILKKAKLINLFDHRIYEIQSACLLDLGEHFESKKYKEIAFLLSK